MEIKDSDQSTKQANLLEIKNLTVDYWTQERNYFRAVDNVSFEIIRGEILGLAGESGSGKSTIASAIMRLVEKPSKLSGEIRLGNSNLLKLNSHQVREYRWKLVSMVFQGAMNSLDPVFNITDQLAEAIRAHERVSKKSATKSSLDLLEKVGINEERALDFPHQLSGGMRQRVMIAMALAIKPRLLIADEPTSALDVVTQKEIVDLLKDLRHTFQLSILFITHDLPILSEICDRLAIMRRGKIIEIGGHDEILQNPQQDYTRLLIESVPSLEITENERAP